MYKITQSTFFLLLLLVVISSCNTDTPVDPDTTLTEQPEITSQNWVGMYQYGNLETQEGGGTLAIAQNEEGQLKFELNTKANAPNSPSGRIAGIVKNEGGKAAWATTEFKDECRLTFLLQEGKIIVNQEQGTSFDCGMAVGTTASGEYAKVSDTPTFMYEQDRAAGLADVLKNIEGRYQSQEGSKSVQVLEVKKLEDNKIKIRSTMNTSGEEFLVLEKELELEGNKAVYQADKKGKSCVVSFTFLANGNVDIKQENSEGCVHIIDMTEVLQKPQ